MTFDIMLNKKCSKLTFMLSVFQIPSKYQPRNRGILLLYSRVEKRGLKQEERERRKKSAWRRTVDHFIKYLKQSMNKHACLVELTACLPSPPQPLLLLLPLQVFFQMSPSLAYSTALIRGNFAFHDRNQMSLQVNPVERLNYYYYSTARQTRERKSREQIL